MEWTDHWLGRMLAITEDMKITIIVKSIGTTIRHV